MGPVKGERVSWSTLLNFGECWMSLGVGALDVAVLCEVSKDHTEETLSAEDTEGELAQPRTCGVSADAWSL